MTIDEEVRTQLHTIFQPLNKVGATRAFPPPAKLSETLEGLIPPRGGASTRSVDSASAAYFATAAVEIWLRGVHSFLISASLTDVSPIWASVSGYYSSHYSVRGLAHLLGYFSLFHKGQIVQLQLGRRGPVCVFTQNPGGRTGGEHQLYWRLVKSNPMFAADPLFTKNSQGSDASDVGHRNRANYIDHIYKYPVFHPLNQDKLKDRIELISKIVFDDPPIPRLSEFPDVEYVQLIAYHRIIRFRKLLDEVLGGRNRFWNVHRNPSFAIEFMDFQLAEEEGLARVAE